MRKDKSILRIEKKVILCDLKILIEFFDFNVLSVFHLGKKGVGNVLLTSESNLSIRLDREFLLPSEN